MVHCEPKFQALLDAASAGDWLPELNEAVKNANQKLITEAINYFSEAKRQLGFSTGNPHKQLLSYYFARVITLCKRQQKLA